MCRAQSNISYLSNILSDVVNADKHYKSGNGDDLHWFQFRTENFGNHCLLIVLWSGPALSMIWEGKFL